MSLPMFNCSAPLFDRITNNTKVPVWFCQNVCAHPLCSGNWQAFSQMSDTSELWSALSSFLICYQSSDHNCTWCTYKTIPHYNLMVMVEKWIHQTVVVRCIVSLWLLIWYSPGIIMTSEYVSAHKSGLKWEGGMPKVQRWVMGIGTVGNPSSQL